MHGLFVRPAPDRCPRITVTNATPITSRAQRLASLDGLRGLAALAVVVYHAGLFVSPALRLIALKYLHLGHAGVIAFFLCSGFMIPLSLERQGSLWRFWVRRICRLYPLYWVSIAGAFVCYGAGLVTPETSYLLFNPVAFLATQPMHTVLANMTMVQGFLGVPHLIGVYWTLTIELLFYVLVSILFVCHVSQRSVALTVGFLVAALLIDVVVPGSGDLLRYMGVMFCGTLVMQGVTGRMPRRTALGVAVLALVLVALPPNLRPWTAFQTLLPYLTARIVAFAAFGLALRWRDRHIPTWLAWLGRISYSLFLIHTLVIWIIPPQGNVVLTTTIWLAATIALSLATYRWIEQPAMRYGQWLTRRSPVGPIPRTGIPA